MSVSHVVNECVFRGTLIRTHLTLELLYDHHFHHFLQLCQVWRDLPGAVCHCWCLHFSVYFGLILWHLGSLGLLLAGWAMLDFGLRLRIGVVSPTAADVGPRLTLTAFQSLRKSNWPCRVRHRVVWRGAVISIDRGLGAITVFHITGNLMWLLGMLWLIGILVLLIIFVVICSSIARTLRLFRVGSCNTLASVLGPILPTCLSLMIRTAVNVTPRMVWSLAVVHYTFQISSTAFNHIMAMAGCVWVGTTAFYITRKVLITGFLVVVREAWLRACLVGPLAWTLYEGRWRFLCLVWAITTAVHVLWGVGVLGLVRLTAAVLWITRMTGPIIRLVRFKVALQVSLIYTGRCGALSKSFYGYTIRQCWRGHLGHHRSTYSTQTHHQKHPHR